jgi:hypothetical protein
MKAFVSLLILSFTGLPGRATASLILGIPSGSLGASLGDGDKRVVADHRILGEKLGKSRSKIFVHSTAASHLRGVPRERLDTYAGDKRVVSEHDHHDREHKKTKTRTIVFHSILRYMPTKMK